DKPDTHPFREKLGVRVVTPAAGRATVEKLAPVDGDIDLLPADPGLAAEVIPGSKGEAIFIVKSDGRTSLVFADLYMHIEPPVPFFMRLRGGKGEPQVAPPMWRLFLMKDRRAVHDYVEKLASMPGLARIVPSHGPIVEKDPSGLLRRLNEKLA